MPRRCRRDARFIVDRMHGDLARWLRILGYDTLYSPSFTDYKIFQIARSTGRIIVTRDKGLTNWARRKGVRAYLVSGVEPEDKLSELARLVGICLDLDPERTRCPLCNTPLRKAGRREVEGRVPQAVLESSETFWVCPRCGKVYWVGSHWRDILSRLDKAKRLSHT